MSGIERGNNHRYLIIARVGDSSLHHEWLKPIEYKNFDLCLSYYGNSPSRFKNDCDIYFESKGPKWPKIKEIIQALGDKISQYEAIWFPDDDILTDASVIHHMFEIFNEQKFELAQPSLTKESYHSHYVTLEYRDYKWRYTQFVEAMVPIFSKNALGKCWHTFDITQSGWGLDLLWPKILGNPHKKIAVIDETQVYHTRPVGTGTLYNGLSPYSELCAVERKYNLDRSAYQLSHYDGVLKDKKIFVVILAHKDEEVLEAQIHNVLHFNPNATVILYKSGKNKDFAKYMRYPICPYSRTIQWARQARVLWDVMKWLDETNVNYEYLVSFDHDMLFVKHGFEELLDDAMQDADCMGWQLLKGTEVEKYPDPRVAETLWKEWDVWQPLFGVNNFLRYFNPGQVFRKRITKKMLDYLQLRIDQKKLDVLWEETNILGFEEMFSVTLAKAAGGKCIEYPDASLYNEAVRWGENITLEEVKQVIKHPSYFWIHPIKGEKLLEMARWLLQNHSNETKDDPFVFEEATKRQLDEVVLEREIDKNLKNNSFKGNLKKSKNIFFKSSIN